jgi:beta-galactosidase GanA
MKAIAIASAVISLLAAGRATAATAPEIPRLVTGADGATRLFVDGKPFVALGGELGNSNASHLAVAKPLFAKLAAMRLNTVLVPVSWELVEPAEGKYSFGLVGDLVREARRHKLRVVLLWFGSWKNGMSSYVPAWVKANPERFPRAEVKDGRRVEALSAFAPANLQADARVFTELMRYLRAVDGRDHTVIMVQVENEVAMIDEAADRSAAARAAFAAPVPKELLDRFPGRKPGTWEQVFGRKLATDELFMAWHYARYVDAVARAGKAAYPLPMLANAALNRAGKLPGQYPSGGPLPHLFEAWKAGAPNLDLLAPDIYLSDFQAWCTLYARPGNPLFIPEAKNENDAAVHALYAVGRGALGFSPFAIESTAEAAAAALTTSYATLTELAPLIAAAGAGKMFGVLFDKESPPAALRFGPLVLTVVHDYTFEWASPARHEPIWPRAGGLIVQIAPDEFVVAGNGIIVRFASEDATVTTGIERVDEGRVADGKFVVTRRLNGDETHQGRHLRLPMGALGVQRVKVYSFK